MRASHGVCLMKLYDNPQTPSTRRVSIFLAEKGIEVPRVAVDVRGGEQFSEAFEALGSGHVVPVLQLDDGACVSESMAICRYFEAVQPEPALMGSGAREQGLVEMWARRVELRGYLAIVDAFRNSSPLLTDRALPGARAGVPQIPLLAERGRAQFGRFLNSMDRALHDTEFVAGPRFSVADITLLVSIDFAARVELGIAPDQTDLARWYQSVSARPSVSA